MDDAGNVVESRDDLLLTVSEAKDPKSQSKGLERLRVILGWDVPTDMRKVKITGQVVKRRKEIVAK